MTETQRAKLEALEKKWRGVARNYFASGTDIDRVLSGSITACADDLAAILEKPDAAPIKAALSEFGVEDTQIVDDLIEGA